MSSIEESSSKADEQSDNRILKTKVVQFENHEESFKHYRKQINHALTYPNQYEKTTFEILLSHQEIQLVKLNAIYNSLNNIDRKPYVKIVHEFKYRFREHQQLIALLDDQEAFLQRIKQSKQINLQLLQEYKETLTWQYLLRGIMALSAAFIVHTIIGASSRWNFLNVYATSYYKITQNPYLFITEDSYASPLSLFCMGLGMRIGIRFEKSIGTFFTTIFATFMGSLFTFLSAFMPNFQLYVFFSFALFPLFSSLAFHSVINECYNYYPKHRLLINAVIIIGTGFGHLFFGLLDTQCINPEDTPSIDGYFGGELDYICRQVPWCMKKTACLIAILGVLAAGLLYPAIKFNESKKIEKKHNRTRLDFEYACASEREALRSKIFWVFVLIILSTTSGSYFLNSNFKNLQSKYQQNTLRLAEFLMAFNFSNSFSRPFWAYIFTKIGFKFCMVIVTTFNIVVLSTISLILQNQQLYMIYYVFAGICLGGCMVCFLNLTTLVFGQFVGQQLPGYVWTGYSLANLLQYFILNCYDTAHSGYTPVLLTLALLNLISLITILRTKLQGEWQNSLNYLQLKCYFK